MKKRTVFFYTLSFLEGASVMAAELLGAKMMAPYFGTSLYVWSAVLGITLGGLALGYFMGGIVSSRQGKEKNLYYVLLASAIFLMLMPPLAKAIMVETAALELLPSILISSLIFLFPPVFCMGMVSPLIVECIASAGDVQHSGKTAGTVYAVSTVGGILSTFFLGFYGIPVFGLTTPAVTIGILMGTVPCFMLIRRKNFLAVLFPLAAFFSLSSTRFPVLNSDVNILYSSEGLLGQIIVADCPLYEDGKKAEGSERILYVNRSTQTIVKLKNGERSFFEYVHLISRRTSDSLAGARALVLGLGGGCVANTLLERGMSVEAVELDARMAEVARKYFDLSVKAEVHVDDARRFLGRRIWEGRGDERYAVIVLDAFIGEVNPYHLFTKEFFGQVNSVLSGTGTFFINGNGYWKGEAGKGMRSVCKTLIHSGFDVEVVPTQPEEEYRNLVFIAKRTKAATGTLTSADISDLDLSDAVVLTDEKPQLELLNAEANRRWREACMKYFMNGYYSGQDRLIFN